MEDTVEKKVKSTPQRLRFTEHENLYLLREVVQNNPFKDPTGWEKIQKNLEILTGKIYLIKTLKNRIERLLEQFSKDDERDQKRSGIEEPQTEKDLLLREIAILASEFKGKTAKKVSKEQQIAAIGKLVRARFADNLILPHNKENENIELNVEIQGVLDDHCYVDFSNIPMENSEVEIPFEIKDHDQNGFGCPASTSSYAEETNTPLTETNTQDNCEPMNNKERRILLPSRKRQRKDPAVKKSCLSYLTDKQEKDREIKWKEIRIQEKKLELEERRLCLEEKKLCLEEKKIEIEIKEREQKLIIEKEKVILELEDKRITTKLLDTQQIIIDNFCKSLNQKSH